MNDSDDTDTMRANYRSEDLKNPVRGQFLGRVKKKGTVVILQPDIAKAFPTSQAVNHALAGLLAIAQSLQLNKKASSPKVAH